jgi:ribonuclease E
MANKMLIDASHPEETRVVVLRGNRVEEFDFESASKKQLRGNIYLAKVTRVEPSLQAAFVEYGGNRHGFLAFSEIHPDYYQIPHADRVALLEEESRAHREDDDEEGSRRRSRRNRRGAEKRRGDDRVTGEVEDEAEEVAAREGASDQAAPGEGPAEARDIAFDAAHGEAHVDAESGEPVEQDAGAEETAAESPVNGAPANESVAAERLAGDDAVAEPPADASAPEQGASEAEAAGAPVAEVVADVVEIAVAIALDAADVAAGGKAASEGAEAPAEAEAGAPSQPHHALFRDPEGFAVVEDGEGDEEVGEGEEEPGEAEAAGSERPVRPAGEAEGEKFEALAEESENGDHEQEEDEIVEQLGGDAMDETPYRAPRLRRQYKIQEVIKRRQVLLIQVVKEERGNKGAALTTYLSLAGRYSVLMPNTARGGGISRKITDAGDRKRLKEIAGELEVPEGMGVILRTAGAARTKQEIQRDFEYLMRMWEQVRELTLTSSAPALVYEEGSLIKRAIRDLYNKEIDEVIVAGENGYREARDFMRLLMPSHVRNVNAYRDPQPIFAKWGAESQLDALFHNQVTLRSGGYLVINQTEALVAIDVNSGRSTREHNIEDTALRTNLEAADEVARQLRLRDLAGLIVVDFIDMEESRNNRAVERRLKEALKDDRARIQVGRISHFGLLEMSRQRIRTGVLEGSSVICPHCAGVGTVRSTSSVAVHVMRVLEDALIKSATHNVVLRTRTDIALYILNQKRALLRVIEERFGVSVTVEADDGLTGGAYHALERGEPADPMRRFDPRRALEDPEPIGEAETEAEFDEEVQADVSEAEAGESDEEGRRRRRRRRGRGRSFDRESSIDSAAPQPSDEGLSMMAAIGGDLLAPAEARGAAEGPAEGEDQGDDRAREEGGRRGRGRWRRRGRGRGGELTEFSGDWRPSAQDDSQGVNAEVADSETADSEGVHSEGSEGVMEGVAPEGERGPSFGDGEPVVAPPPAEGDAIAALPAEPAPAAPEAPEPPPAETFADEPAAVEDRPEPPAPPTQPELPVITEADPSAPKRSGWWSRAKASLSGK